MAEGNARPLPRSVRPTFGYAPTVVSPPATPEQRCEFEDFGFIITWTFHNSSGLPFFFRVSAPAGWLRVEWCRVVYRRVAVKGENRFDLLRDDADERRS